MLLIDGVVGADVDKEGNLLVAEPTNWRPQFFRPKKNANPDELIKALKK